MDAYIGTIVPCVYNYAPEGWLMCDGRTYPISQYQALYSLIGNQYGGDNYNFAVPDLRGRVMVGQGQYVPTNHDNPAVYAIPQIDGSTQAKLLAHTHMAQLTSNVLSGSATLQVSANPATASTPGASLIPAAPVAVDSGGGTPPHIYGYGAQTNTVTMPCVSLVTNFQGSLVNTSQAGSAQASNMQPFIPLYFMIATYGIYPVRP